MHVHKIHLYFSILTGLVALVAAVPSHGVDTAVDGTTALEGPDGPYDLIIGFDADADDTIRCLVSDPGYNYFGEQADGNIDISVLNEVYDEPALLVDSPHIRIIRHLNGVMSEEVADIPFDLDTLAETGHAYVTAGPFKTDDPPPEQILTLSTETNGVSDAFFVLLHPYDPDLDYDCTVFTTVGEMDGSTGLTVTKKAAKKKISKASKRKVHKKKALIKAKARKKKAATPW